MKAAKSIIITTIITTIISAATAKPWIKLSKSGTFHNNIERINKAAKKAGIPEVYDFGIYTKLSAILTSKDIANARPDHFTIQYLYSFADAGNVRQDIECWQNENQIVIASISNGIRSSNKADVNGYYGKNMKAFIFMKDKVKNEEQILVYQSTSKDTKDGAIFEVSLKKDKYTINWLNSSYYWIYNKDFTEVSCIARDYDNEEAGPYPIYYSNTYLKPSLDVAAKMAYVNELILKEVGYFVLDAAIAEDPKSPYTYR